MSSLFKALLLSAFVMPGLGQIYLKHYIRGIIYMVLVSAGLIWIALECLQVTMSSLDQMAMASGEDVTGGILNLTQQITGKLSQTHVKGLGYFLSLVYVISILDTLLIGQRKPKAPSEG